MGVARLGRLVARDRDGRRGRAGAGVHCQGMRDAATRIISDLLAPVSSATIDPITFHIH